MCALRWRDVSLDEGVIRIRRALAEARATDTYCGETLEEKLPKSNRSNRDVIIPEETVEFLRHHKQMQLYRLMYNDIEQGEDTPVFCSDLGELYRPSKFTSDFSRFAQHKSFDLTLHGTRHTHASLLLKKGVPIQYVSSRLGHESIEITYKIYAHFSPETTEAPRRNGATWPSCRRTSSAFFPLPDSLCLPWVTATNLPQAPKRAATTRKKASRISD